MVKGRHARSVVVASAVAVMGLLSACNIVARSSIGFDGSEPDGASRDPAPSRTGALLAFTSSATNLVVGDSNGADDIFLRNEHLRTTRLVSQASDGGPADGPSGSPQISADGVVVAFTSAATNLVTDDVDGLPDVFVRDLASGTTRRIGAIGGDVGEDLLALSGDGSLVAYVGGAGSTTELRLHDLTSGTSEVLDAADDPAVPTRFDEVALSADGSTVAFTEIQTIEGVDHIGLAIYDRAAGSRSWVVPPGLEPCCSPALDADGDTLAYTVDGDVIVRDRTTDVESWIATGFGPTLSEDGERLAWSADTVYLRDLVASVTERLPPDAPMASAVDARGELSGDGRVVAMEQAGSLYLRVPTPVPAATAPAVSAGSNPGFVTLQGAFFDPGISGAGRDRGLQVQSVARHDSREIRLGVEVDAGAELGERSIELRNVGPGGVTSETQCQCVSVTWAYPSPDPAPARPNVVLVVTDDQRWDSMALMPRTNGRSEWAHFTDAYVNEPQCCPSRASILTGQYSHHTGVEDLVSGGALDEDHTIVTLLDGVGYRTGFFGKYVNGYPFGRGYYVPPGWDDFASYTGATNYYDYRLVENGQVVEYGHTPDDYSTDNLTTLARRFLRATGPDEPFFLYLALNAPHIASTGLPIGPDRHARSCDTYDFQEPPSYNAFDAVDEPEWMAAAPGFTPLQNVLSTVNACRALRGADDAIAGLFSELEASGRLDDTIVVVTSDNGYSFGEHRLFGKGHLYEESVRVPLLARGPSIVPGSYGRLTSNVDLAPTIAEWAGVTTDAPFDGSSFAPTLRGDPAATDPDAVLLRGCRTSMSSGQECGGYFEHMGMNWGLRTRTHKFILYPDGYVQLFDLRTDPFELTNLALDPAQGDLIAELTDQLQAMRGP